MNFSIKKKLHQSTKYLAIAGLVLISSRSAIAQKKGGAGGVGGEFSIDFTAAAPNTYNHQTGGGAFNDGSAGKNNDVVESLEGGDFSCQDTVTYLAEIVVGSGLPAGEAYTIELNLDFLADTTGQPGVGHDKITNVAINYGQVENGDSGTGSNPGVGSFGTDSGINDDGGSTATLISQTVSNPPPLQGNNSVLTGKIHVNDLEAGETVVLRVDTSLTCAPDTGPTGNIQGSTLDATVVDDGSTISVGRQTIPFKQIGNIAGAGKPLLEFQKSVTTDLTGNDTVGSEQITATQGDTVRYLYKVSNLGSASLFDLQITDDNGTPGNTSDDFTVNPTNILSGTGNLADLDGNGDNPELRSVTEVVLYADIVLANAGTITNTATATGADGSGGNAATLTVTDTAQVVAGAANFASPTIDLDGDDSSGASNQDFNTSYTLGGSAVKVVDENATDENQDIVIADTDSTQLSQAIITLTNNPAITGDTLAIDAAALSAIASGAITADTSVASKIILSGDADLADYEAALELIEFSSTSSDTTARTVTFQVSDINAQTSNTATTNINVSATSQTDKDYGDAPDSYGDASHEIPASANLYLGNAVPDGEVDTQLTSASSAGDDDDGNDDEDAFVVLPNVPLVDPSLTNISLGRNYSLNVPVTNTTGNEATLHAWIDFNQNGRFEAQEYQTAKVINNASSASLSWNIPLTTIIGDTHARFRLTSDTLTDNTGLLDSVNPIDVDDRSIGNATDGEVEDYPVSIAVPLYDYGDAPDTATGTGTGNYQTTESDEGPTHIVIKDPLDLLHLSLGNNIDGDDGSLQNLEANADDGDTKNVDLVGTVLSNDDNGLDDEDGVSSFPTLTADAGQTYTVPVTVRNNIPLLNAYLVGYIDFNKDGDFEDPGEKSTTVTVASDLLELTNNSVSLDTTGEPRTFNVTFNVPTGVTPGETYARFRLGSIKEIVESATGVSVSTNNGKVNNGEVEDYQITIASAAANTISGRIFEDFGSGTTSNDSPEAGENGLDGITLSLYQDNGDGVFDTTNDILDNTTTSDTDGTYRLGVDSDGTYFVVLDHLDRDAPNINTALPDRTVRAVTISGTDATNQDFPFDPVSSSIATCPTDAYLFQTNPSDPYSLNLATGNNVQQATDIGNRHINAIGFNMKDSYIYGSNNTDSDGTISKVDINSFNVTTLGPIIGLPTGTNFIAGDVSLDGKLHFIKGRNLYIIDTNPSSPTYLQFDSVNLNSGVGITDLAFNPIDGQIYTVVNKNKTLYRIDPDTGKVENLGSTGITGNSTFGAQFYDKSGFFYISRNQDGKIFRLDTRNPASIDPKATLFADGPISGTNDGARCANAPIPIDFGDAPDSYGTSLASNGARHNISSDTNLYLGVTPPDAEVDGQPSDTADGDGADDSELTLPGLSEGDTSYTILADNITAAGSGTLHAWVDFDKSGSFELDEYQSVEVTDGNSAGDLTWTGITTSAAGDTYVRLRLTSDTLTDDPRTANVDERALGIANDGEVEDYQITIAPATASITIDLDGDDSSGAANNNVNTLYVLGGSVVEISNKDNADESVDTVINVPNGTQISRMVVTLQKATPLGGDKITIDAAALSAIASGAIITTSVANRIILNGDASIADYEAAFELIQFTTTSTSTDESERTITVQIFDNNGRTNLAPARVNLDVMAIPPIECEYCQNP